MLTRLFRRCNIIGVRNKQTDKATFVVGGTTMKFIHTISSNDVREFCISNNLYTRGDDEGYNKMLALANKLHNCTPQRVVVIAKDIIKHSDRQDAKIDLSLENVVYHLCEDVMHTIIEFDD